MELAESARIGAVYDFVRNGIAFGYNASDDLAATAIMARATGSATRRRPC